MFHSSALCPLGDYNSRARRSGAGGLALGWPLLRETSVARNPATAEVLRTRNLD
jgi:hypothetical protein